LKKNDYIVLVSNKKVNKPQMDSNKKRKYHHHYSSSQKRKLEDVAKQESSKKQKVPNKNLKRKLETREKEDDADDYYMWINMTEGQFQPNAKKR
jgi:hypothetical protein